MRTQKLLRASPPTSLTTRCGVLLSLLQIHDKIVVTVEQQHAQAPKRSATPAQSYTPATTRSGSHLRGSALASPNLSDDDGLSDDSSVASQEAGGTAAAVAAAAAAAASADTAGLEQVARAEEGTEDDGSNSAARHPAKQLNDAAAATPAVEVVGGAVAPLGAHDDVSPQHTPNAQLSRNAAGSLSSDGSGLSEDDAMDPAFASSAVAAALAAARQSQHHPATAASVASDGTPARAMSVTSSVYDDVPLTPHSAGPDTPGSNASGWFTPGDRSSLLSGWVYRNSKRGVSWDRR